MNKFAPVLAVLSLIAIGGSIYAAKADDDGNEVLKYTLRIVAYERDSASSPVNEWRPLSGVLKAHYSDHSSPLNDPRKFMAAVEAPFQPSLSNNLTRLDVVDTHGTQLAYCSDVHFGLMGGWIYRVRHMSLPSEMNTYVLQIVRTKDGSAKTLATGLGSVGGCDGF